MTVHVKSGRLRLALATALAAALLTSCTTVNRTASLQSGADPGSGIGPGVSDGSAAGSTGAAGTSGGNAVGTTGGGVGATGGTSSIGTTGGGSAGSAGTSGGVGGSATGAAGTGTCKAPVKIGVSHSSDSSAAAAAFGGSSAGVSGDQLSYYDEAQKAANKRMVEWLNANGGLGPGCPAAVSFHDFKTFNSDGHAGQTQTECTAFAQAQKVNIAFPSTLETSLIIPCLAKSGIVTFFDSLNYAPSPQDFTKYRGLLYQTQQMTPYRWAPFVPLLQRSGYFSVDARGNKTPKPVVGIILADAGDGHNQHLVNKLWMPELNKLGYKSVVYSINYSSGDVSQFSAAVLEFKRQGVTHVMITPDGGGAALYFPQAADGQAYYPRYGINSLNSAPSFQLLVSDSQQNNMMLVSTQPFDVLGNGDFVEYYKNGRTPNQAKCAEIFKGKIPRGMVIEVMYVYCDRYLLLQQALKGQPAVNSKTLLAGMDALGRAYVPAAAYGNPFFGAPRHYDGGSHVRVAAFRNSDNKWLYVSPKTSIPLS